MNFSFVASAASCAIVGIACGPQAAPLSPQVPPDLVLDQMDAAVLDAAREQAPTFAEVAGVKNDGARRFRAWLGWTRPSCEPCPADATASCTPVCAPGRPFVCTRPARVIACHDEEIVTTTVAGEPDALPAAGVYVFEGRWSAPGEADGFTITSISPLRMAPQP